MQNRYKKNIDDILTQDVQNTLLTKNIAVIGCGGQGGYILEFLTRLGVNSITFWDGDIYEHSNLNRQIGCTELTLGENKAITLYNKLQQINSDIILIPKNWYFGDKDSDLQEILSVDFVFIGADCYYNVEIWRKILKEVINAGIPVIDCPVNILGGSVYIETKNDLGHFDFITDILVKQSQTTTSPECSQTAYKCALIAAEAVNQMVLYFKNSRYACVDTQLDIDIYHHKYTFSDKYGFF